MRFIKNKVFIISSLFLLILPAVFFLQQNTNFKSSAQVASTTVTPTPIPGYNTIQPPVLSSNPPVAVTTCPGTVSSNTNYVLNQDIVQNTSTQACFYLNNASAVSIDCQGHQIIPQGSVPSPISTNNANNFSIKNCTVTGGIGINSSNTGVVDHNIMSSPSISTMNNGGNTNLTITNNTMTKVGYLEQYSSWVEFSNNTVVDDGSVFSAGKSGTVEIRNGTNDNIMNNTIDGQWNGNSSSQLGADDAIMLISRSNDYISGNTLKNSWDCGIETVGQQTSQKIVNNTLTNTGYCGIGGWYQNSWKGNLVQGNKVSGAKMLFQLFVDNSQFSQYQPSTYYFQDNQFIDNSFLSGTPSNTNSANMNFDTRYLPAGLIPVVGNNSFQNNNFGTFDTGPNLLPTSMIVDLGGNLCSPTPSLNCGGTTPTPTIAPTATPTPIPTSTPTPTPTPTAMPTPTPTPIPVDIQSPTITFTYPTNGGGVPRNKTITITFNVSDNVGVTKVVTYVNNVLQCTDTTSPYSCSWTVPSRKGTTYSLSAKAYDAAGNVGTTSITVKAQ